MRDISSKCICNCGSSCKCICKIQHAHAHANQIQRIATLRGEVNVLSARYEYISNECVSVALNWSIGLSVCLVELLIVFGCFVSQN